MTWHIKQVSELWSFDVSTYQWHFINTTVFDSPHPLPREQHSSVVIDRDLYVFGGKTRLFAKDNTGAFTYTPHSDHVYGDLWKLSIERARKFSLHYTHTDVVIPDKSVFYATVSGFENNTILAESDGVTPRSGLCIDKAVVNVRTFPL